MPIQDQALLINVVVTLTQSVNVACHMTQYTSFCCKYPHLQFLNILSKPAVSLQSPTTKNIRGRGKNSYFKISTKVNSCWCKTPSCLGCLPVHGKYKDVHEELGSTSSPVTWQVRHCKKTDSGQELFRDEQEKSSEIVACSCPWRV